MGLVGSLDDLGLGEILQIISLSGKSGVLNLSSPMGKGSIVFCKGLIQRSNLNGGARSLGELLIRGKLLGEADYPRALELSRSTGLEIEAVLQKEFDISRAEIDTLKKKNIENAVLEMFKWATGDFCFEVEETDDGEDPALSLEGGLNAQFLAMEGSRLCDEARFQAASDFPDTEAEIATKDASTESFAVQEEESEFETPVIAEAHRVEPSEFADVAQILDESLLAEAVNVIALAAADHVELEDPLVGFNPSQADVSAHEVNAHSIRGTFVVIAVDPEHKVLEWIREVLGAEVSKLHLLQDLDSAMKRIRQYVVRGEQPIVIISGTFSKLGGFLERLKKMAPKIRIMALGSKLDENSTFPAAAIEAFVERPSPAELGRPRLSTRLDALGQALREFTTN